MLCTPKPCGNILLLFSSKLNSIKVQIPLKKIGPNNYCSCLLSPSTLNSNDHYCDINSESIPTTPDMS
jgi:hypothetical protein